MLSVANARDTVTIVSTATNPAATRESKFLALGCCNNLQTLIVTYVFGLIRPCGCGSGDSGCAECGLCRTCAGESVADEQDDSADDNSFVEMFSKARKASPLEVLIGVHNTPAIHLLVDWVQFLFPITTTAGRGVKNADKLEIRRLIERQNLMPRRARVKVKKNGQLHATLVKFFLNVTLNLF